MWLIEAMVNKGRQRLYIYEPIRQKNLRHRAELT